MSQNPSGRPPRLAGLQWIAIALLAASFVVSAASESSAAVVLNYVFLALACVVLTWGIWTNWRESRRRS